MVFVGFQGNQAGGSPVGFCLFFRKTKRRSVFMTAVEAFGVDYDLGSSGKMATWMMTAPPKDMRNDDTGRCAMQWNAAGHH